MQIKKANQFDKPQMRAWERVEDKNYDAVTTYFERATAENKKQ